ncbi:PEP-utilizing enzyme [Saccharopolyspora spinosporotrichia]
MKLAMAMWFRAYGAKVDPIDGPGGFVDVGGRLYGDLTDLVRSTWTRKRLPRSMQVYGPRVSAAVERVLADPRFRPQPGPPFRVGPALRAALRITPSAVAGIARSLVSPAAARRRAFDEVEEIKRQAAAPAELNTATERLRFVEEVQRLFMGPEVAGILWPLATGMLVSAVPSGLLRGIAGDAELDTVLGGLPHNVTTEMDMALWRLATAVPAEHRELLLNTPPTELAALYRQGTLPDVGMAEFLGSYGHRAAAEVDIGVPRWSEDPAPVFATIANYLRTTDPEQYPDRRFEQAAVRAEAKIDELVRRARRTRPIRGRLVGFFLRRSRELTGLRELGKFAWLYTLDAMRGQLLLIGAELVARGLLDHPDDIMLLEIREARAAVQGDDLREVVSHRRAVHERESRRPRVPVAVLSDGTEPEALTATEPAEDGALTGLGAAPGQVTGRARVILDPAGAHIEPGEILVAPTTDPGWTPLFMTAAGLVTETGAPMAHGPTVAREYGIPAVICVRNAVKEIETGQLITIDGAAGTVIRKPQA